MGVEEGSQNVDEIPGSESGDLRMACEPRAAPRAGHCAVEFFVSESPIAPRRITPCDPWGTPKGFSRTSRGF